MKENRKGMFQDPKINTDPMGSYTGKPKNAEEDPMQDADDL